MNVDIDGMFNGVRINGVDVTAYVSAELARIEPGTRAHGADRSGRNARGMARGLLSLGRDHRTRARQLPEETLHASVNGEFSFVQTLRHLIFAIDKWVTVPILGGEFDPMGLPNTGSLDFPFPGLDLAADPSFADTLAVRRDRAAALRASISPGSNRPTSPRSVRSSRTARRRCKACLHTVFEEEIAHLGYATRDLDALEAS